jgi:hypothetical protein
MHGEFCLAKTRSLTLGISAAQTIEYKGFGGKKAREMARRGLADGDDEPEPAASSCRNSL